MMAEEHKLKDAKHMPTSVIVAVPSCEARPPQRRRSRIKRCVTPALPVKRTGSLVERTRQTYSKSLLQQRSPTMSPLTSWAPVPFLHRRNIKLNFEGRYGERADGAPPFTHPHSIASRWLIV